MAKKTMTPVKADYNKITGITMEAATSASDGFEFKLKNTDEYVFVVVQNTHGSNAGTITVKAPTAGSYCAASADLVSSSIAAGGLAVIRVESAKYANNDGTIKLVPSSTDVKAVAIY